MKPIFVLPATCELCGSWLPSHTTSCPRNGKHPSQWKLRPEITEIISLTIKDIDDEDIEKENYLSELSI